MKSQFIISIFILFSFLLIFESCFKDPIETEIPVYSNFKDIVYPPDTFQLVYNLNTYIDYSARIKFDTSGVWKIKKITALSAQFWAERQYNEDSVNSIIIYDSLNIGFEGKVFYDFFANNNSHYEARNFFIRFEKTSINYETFNPKL
ncbi:MAG: hypothetical protein K8R41_12645 [Bacteroidales bacterium]|nr:hypothetical protein [Bacteroidales bacterium]